MSRLFENNQSVEDRRLPVPIGQTNAGRRTATRGQSLLELLKRLILGDKRKRRRDPGPAAAPAEEGPPLVIAVAQLNNDIDNEGLPHLLKMLENRPGLEIRVIERPVTLAGSEPAQMNAAFINARHEAADADADLLIWGDVFNDGDEILLRFTSVVTPDDERPGAFPNNVRLELPIIFEEPLGNLLYTVILASIEPEDEARRQRLRQLLPSATKAVEGIAGRPPLGINTAQQRLILSCLGHAMAHLTVLDPEGGWGDKANACYQAALKRIGRNDPPLESAMLHKGLAVLQMIQADVDRDPAKLEAAIAAYREVLEMLPRGIFPQEWGNMQNRLGLALFKLDLQVGKNELLKESFGAFQAALSVFNRHEQTQKWAEIMHNMAQALEVYGDQMRSPEILQKAVDACVSVLDVCRRETMPYSWAAVMNTMGLALFLKDKHSEGSAHLANAAECLQQARELYQLLGARKLQAIAEKNLQRVDALAEERRERERKVVQPLWAFEEDPLPEPEVEILPPPPQPEPPLRASLWDRLRPHDAED